MKKTELFHYELAERIRQGESIAFELLFNLYYKSLLNFAIVYVKNKDISAEIVQETFIKIWEIRTSIDKEKSLKAFLFQCVHNNCINYLKKAEVSNRLSEEYKNDTNLNSQITEPDLVDAYYNALADEQREHSVQNALDNLPQQCREIFILCRFENLTYIQIAEKLNISVNTVKTQLQRAVAKLRESLKEYFPK